MCRGAVGVALLLAASCTTETPGPARVDGPRDVVTADSPGTAPRNPWQEAQDRGVDFRAIGQEPGWLLEIDNESSLRLSYDYGERMATMPVPAAVVAGERTTYSARTGEHDLTIVIDERSCEDVMSGEPYPHTVTVTIAGRELRGCGRALRR